MCERAIEKKCTKSHSWQQLYYKSKLHDSWKEGAYHMKDSCILPERNLTDCNEVQKHVVIP